MKKSQRIAITILTIVIAILLVSLLVFSATSGVSMPNLIHTESPSSIYPVTYQKPSGDNLIRNGNFFSDTSEFRTYSCNTLTRAVDGAFDAGSLWLKSVQDCGAEGWTGLKYANGSTALVGSGDRITAFCWFKAGEKGTDRPNDGANYGWDLRFNGDQSYTQIFTYNSASTMNRNWTFVYGRQTIPCALKGEQGELWYTSDGQSGTINGANTGVWDNAKAQSYVGKKLPRNMTVTLWVQIWHRDSLKEAFVDNCEAYIERDVLKC